MINILFFFKKFTHSLRKNNLDKIILVLLLTLTGGIVGISYFEPTLSPLDSLWWAVVTVTTVGYGDIAPTTPGG